MSHVSDLPTMASSTWDPQSGIARGMDYLVSLANELSSSNQNHGIQERKQEYVDCAHQELTAVKEQLENQLRAIDSQTADLADILELKKEMGERKLHHNQLKIQLKYHEETNKYAQEMVETAKEHLRKLQEKQEKVRQEENWYKIARNIALVFMPLSTLMAGIMSAIFQTSLYTAQRADQELQEAIGCYETKVLEYQNNFSQSNKEGEEIKENIEVNEERIQEIEGKLNKRSELSGDVEEQQDQLRKHVSFLGQLVGNIDPLKSKVKFHKDEAALNLLKDIVTQWLDKDGQEFLNFLGGEKIRNLVGKLEYAIQLRDVS